MYGHLGLGGNVGPGDGVHGICVTGYWPEDWLVYAYDYNATTGEYSVEYGSGYSEEPIVTFNDTTHENSTDEALEYLQQYRNGTGPCSKPYYYNSTLAQLADYGPIISSDGNNTTPIPLLYNGRNATLEEVILMLNRTSYDNATLLDSVGFTDAMEGLFNKTVGALTTVLCGL